MNIVDIQYPVAVLEVYAEQAVVGRDHQLVVMYGNVMDMVHALSFRRRDKAHHPASWIQTVDSLLPHPQDQGAAAFRKGCCHPVGRASFKSDIGRDKSGGVGIERTQRRLGGSRAHPKDSLRVDEHCLDGFVDFLGDVLGNCPVRRNAEGSLATGARPDVPEVILGNGRHRRGRLERRRSRPYGLHRGIWRGFGKASGRIVEQRCLSTGPDPAAAVHEEHVHAGRGYAFGERHGQEPSAHADIDPGSGSDPHKPAFVLQERHH